MAQGKFDDSDGPGENGAAQNGPKLAISFKTPSAETSSKRPNLRPGVSFEAPGRLQKYTVENAPASRRLPEGGLDEGDGKPDSEDEDAFLEDDAGSLIGVSIGKEQTRLLSPTTPAAERSAALDQLNSFGFFHDATIEENREAEEEILSGERPSTEGLTIDTNIVSEETLPKRTDTSSSFGLPSPWVSGPRASTTPIGSKIMEKIVPGRQRANTVNILGDGAIKKFISNIPLPDMPKFSFGDGGKGSEGSSRHGRSLSLLSWGKQSPVASSPTRQEGSASAAHTRSPSLAQSKPPNLSSSQQLPKRPQSQGTPALRKSVSLDSLYRPQLNRVPTLGDSKDWDHVNSQVNIRMKAVRDSISDTLPSFPTLNLNAFRPDIYNKPSDNGRVPGSLSAVFGSTGGSASIPAASPPLSPRKFTIPKFPSLDEALEQLTGDVIIMGGYRGSVLRSAEYPNRQLWVPVKVGLNLRKVDLEVGLEPEDEESMEERIYASGMLTHIGPIDIGRRLLKRLNGCRNAKEGKLKIHNYGYDWRLSPHLLSRKLIEFASKLKCNAEGTDPSQRGVWVIAHSLGGLITRHAINQRPELFAGVVYAGTPQHCVNILGPLRNGDEVLLSSRVLTAQVNFTLRTSFLLLPENGRCFIDQETQEEYPVDFFDPEDWQKYAFSPCVGDCLPPLEQPERRSIFGSVSSLFPSGSNTPTPSRQHSDCRSRSSSNPQGSTSTLQVAAQKALNSTNGAAQHLNPASSEQPAGGDPLDMQLNPPAKTPYPQPATPATQCTIPRDKAVAYLARTLAETKRFKRETGYMATHQRRDAYPPAAVLYSVDIPTVYGARVRGRDAIRHADAYRALAFASGDGVVLARAAMLPRGYVCAEGGKVRTERGHVGMLGDLEGVGRCLLAIVRERRGRGVGLGVNAVEEGSEGRKGDGVMGSMNHE